jgi:hypothetical protein
MIIDSYSYERIAVDAAAETELGLANWYGVRCLMLRQWSNGVMVAVSRDYYYQEGVYERVDAGSSAAVQYINDERIAGCPGDDVLVAAVKAGIIRGAILSNYDLMGNWWAASDAPTFYNDMTAAELMAYLSTKNENIGKVNVWPAKNDYQVYIAKADVVDRSGLRYEISNGVNTLICKEKPGDGDEFAVAVDRWLVDSTEIVAPNVGYWTLCKGLGGLTRFETKAYDGAGGELVYTEMSQWLHYVRAGVAKDNLIDTLGRPFVGVDRLSVSGVGTVDAPYILQKNDNQWVSMLLNYTPLPERVDVVVKVNKRLEDGIEIIPAVYGPDTNGSEFVYDVDGVTPIDIILITVPGELLSPAEEIYSPTFFVLEGNTIGLKATDVVTLNVGYEALGLAEYDSEDNDVVGWEVWLVGDDGRRIGEKVVVSVDRNRRRNEQKMELIWLNSIGGWESVVGLCLGTEGPSVSYDRDVCECDVAGVETLQVKGVSGVAEMELRIGHKNGAVDAIVADILMSEAVFVLDEGTQGEMLKAVTVLDSENNSNVLNEYIGERYIKIKESKNKVSYGLG